MTRRLIWRVILIHVPKIKLENTIVLVTGDHGEEFFENGFWGHHSNFSQEQVAVPFVLRGPGISPGMENRPTSHIDLPRTLMELLGISPEMAPRYTLGENLLRLPANRKIVSSSWSSLAMQISDTETMVLSAYSDDIPIRAYGRDWQPLKDENAVLREKTADLRKLLHGIDGLGDHAVLPTEGVVVVRLPYGPNILAVVSLVLKTHFPKRAQAM